MDSLKCSICGKPAVVRIEQMVNSLKQTMNLCEACARNYGVLPNNASSFSVMKNIGATLFSDLNPSMASDLHCGHCGCTLEFLKKTGNVGCSQCYEDLKRKLLSLIENMQKGLRHIGKQPAEFVGGAERSSSREILEEKLRQAIGVEDFEGAAKIRDQLRSLPESEND